MSHLADYTATSQDPKLAIATALHLLDRIATALEKIADKPKYERIVD